MAEERDPDPIDDRPESDDRDVWTGRAGVRPYGAVPRNPYDEESDWADPAQPEPSGRWWAPIAVGTVALALLGLLAIGIAVIVQNAGEDAETPETTPSAARLTTGPEPGPTTQATGGPATSTTDAADQEVNVPALRGMPLADAQAALDRSGLKWRVIRRESDAEPDTVINCDPAEGQQVPSDTRVTLVVAAARPSTPPATGPSTGASG